MCGEKRGRFSASHCGLWSSAIHTIAPAASGFSSNSRATWESGAEEFPKVCGGPQWLGHQALQKISEIRSQWVDEGKPRGFKRKKKEGWGKRRKPEGQQGEGNEKGIYVFVCSHMPCSLALSVCMCVHFLFCLFLIPFQIQRAVLKGEEEARWSWATLFLQLLLQTPPALEADSKYEVNFWWLKCNGAPQTNSPILNCPQHQDCHEAKMAATFITGVLQATTEGSLNPWNERVF